MSRMYLDNAPNGQEAIDALYAKLANRLAANPNGLCPVESAQAFLRLAHSQSCGKCVPCRIGLGQLVQLMEEVLDGTATMQTLTLIEKTAESIYLTADCAIGYEAARMALNSVKDFKDDFTAHIKEGRCLGNLRQSIPCVSFCPAKVDIPGYIALVGEGRYGDAVQLIRKDNPFPTACAFVCEHPCEHDCRRNMVDDAINIRALKRYAVDHAEEVPAPANAPSTGKTIAIVGGGPSGMTAAYYLQLMGHQVTVFERLGALGGMIRYGIPSYRLPRERLDEDLNHILSTGVEVKYNVNVGTDITLDELKAQYDAVYLSIGAHTDKKLRIEGENANGVMSAVEMLRLIGENNPPDFKGKRVVVVGGGNVAMDVARSSVRLGAENVYIAYRRRKSDMTALPEEVEGAIAEGCEVLEMYAPDRVKVDENNNCVAMCLRPQMAGAIDRSGRPSPVDAPAPIMELECDIVVVAIGQNIQSEYFAENGIPCKWGTIVAGDDTIIENVDGVFSGGDCVTGPATVIRAIAAGKVAAANIDEYLGFAHELDFGVTVPEPTLIDRTPCGRCNTKEREAADRKNDFTMIEFGLSDAEAKQEALRCLRCDKYGLASLKGGAPVMISIIIDNKQLNVAEGTTILQAARDAGIAIPTLCYLEGINDIGACRLCIVEVEGQTRLVPSCNTKAEDGMVIHTNTEKVRNARRLNAEMILSQHHCECTTCVRSGNCVLQKIANDLGIMNISYPKKIKNITWNQEYPLIRDESRCVKCMRCIQVCNKVQGMRVWDVVNTGGRTTVGLADGKTIDTAACALCGQCITHCPVGALKERDDTDKVLNAIADPDIITVVQVAPAVRTAWGEALGLSDELATEKRMAAALRKLGFDYVFDTNFSADLTIMEEGSELVHMFEHTDWYDWPLFTSCCPGWVRFLKTQYPEMVEHLSTSKSPQQMFGAVAKSYFAEQIDVDPKKIYSVSIMPCLAKKYECAVEDLNDAGAGQDVDVVLTTREFTRMIKRAAIDAAMLPEEEFDSPLGTGTGAAVIFGATGGVMEAALRSAYYLIKGENPPAEAFTEVRGGHDWREATFEVNGITLRTAVASGLGNARKLVEAIKAGEVQYDFVEVMACPGGCAGGGGQPIHEGCELFASRGQKLYALDAANTLRFSHENPAVQAVYRDFFKKPLSNEAEELLHTNQKYWNL